ncbi:unnamed protein product, partial [Lymnaea stagnalis]
QSHFDILNSTCEISAIKISKDTTEVMSVERDHFSRPYLSKSRHSPSVEFKYLESIFTEDNGEIESSAQRADLISYQISPPLETQAKKKACAIYAALILTLTYKCRIWALNLTQDKTMQLRDEVLRRAAGNNKRRQHSEQGN